MARVTVEDCVLRVPNRFELVMLAAQRARAISSGAELTVDRDRDRNPVVALREIAEETVPVDDLREALVQGMQKHVEVDEPEEEDLDFGSSTFQSETAVAVAATEESGEDESGDDAGDEGEAADDEAEAGDGDAEEEVD